MISEKRSFLSRENIVIALFVIALFAIFASPISDLDFPFHLKTGEYIYTHWEIPKEDPFTSHSTGIWTAQKIFMLSQYWLANVLFYKLYSLTGFAGIVVLRAIVFSLFVFLLFLERKRAGIYSSLTISVLVSILLLSYALDRPQYFSFIFTLIMVILMEKFRRFPDQTTPLFFIPPLMLLWANMHGGFIFGIALLCIYALTESLKYVLSLVVNPLFFGKSFSAERLLWFLTAVLSGILASYINPNGNMALLIIWDGYTDFIWIVNRVIEYQSPLAGLRSPLLNKLHMISFWVVYAIISSLLALHIIRRKGIDLTVFCLFVFASIASFNSMRYIPLAIAIMFPITRDFTFFNRNIFSNDRIKRIVFTIIFSIFFVIIICYGFHDYRNKFNLMQNHKFYPEKTVKFLLDNPIKANMFNSINKGSYLLWRLYPHYKVFSDTRYIDVDVVGEGDVIRFALKSKYEPTWESLAYELERSIDPRYGKIKLSFSSGILNVSQPAVPYWKSLLKKYNIDLIVHEAVSDYEGALFPLTLALIRDDEWVLIHHDGRMLVFIRNNEMYADIIAKHKKSKDRIYDEIVLETFPAVKRRVVQSLPYSSLAFALTMKGKYDDAKKMVDAALDLDKRDMVALFCEAYIAMAQKKNK